MTERHLSSGDNNEAICNICNEQVDSPKSTLIHFLKHRDTWHICTCGKAYPSETLLLQHKTDCTTVKEFCDRCVSHLCTCISDIEDNPHSDSDSPQNRWWDSEEDTRVRCGREDHANSSTTNN